MVQYWEDFQFGVGVLGGIEAVLHVVNRMVRVEQHNPSETMMPVDF